MAVGLVELLDDPWAVCLALKMVVVMVARLEPLLVWMMAEK